MLAVCRETSEKNKGYIHNYEIKVSVDLEDPIIKHCLSQLVTFIDNVSEDLERRIQDRSVFALESRHCELNYFS